MTDNKKIEDDIEDLVKKNEMEANKRLEYFQEKFDNLENKYKSGKIDKETYNIEYSKLEKEKAIAREKVLDDILQEGVNNEVHKFVEYLNSLPKETRDAFLYQDIDKD